MKISDPEYYCKIDTDPFPSWSMNFQALIKIAQEQSIITKEEYKFINIPFPNKPFFYHLPKIHKDLKNPHGRPIISGIHGKTSNMSHYIDLYLQNYVRKLESHLEDSNHLIKDFLDLPRDEGLGLLTKDITFFYSNINPEIGKAV